MRKAISIVWMTSLCLAILTHSVRIHAANSPSDAEYVSNVLGKGVWKKILHITYKDGSRESFCLFEAEGIIWAHILPYGTQRMFIKKGTDAMTAARVLRSNVRSARFENASSDGGGFGIRLAKMNDCLLEARAEQARLDKTPGVKWTRLMKASASGDFGHAVCVYQKGSQVWVSDQGFSRKVSPRSLSARDIAQSLDSSLSEASWLDQPGKPNVLATSRRGGKSPDPSETQFADASAPGDKSRQEKALKPWVQMQGLLAGLGSGTGTWGSWTCAVWTHTKCTGPKKSSRHMTKVRHEKTRPTSVILASTQSD